MRKKSALFLLMVLLTSLQMVSAETMVIGSGSSIHFALDRGKGKSKAPKIKKQKRLAGKGKSKAPVVKKARRQANNGKSKAPKVKKASKGKNYSKRDNYP